MDSSARNEIQLNRYDTVRIYFTEALSIFLGRGGAVPLYAAKPAPLNTTRLTITWIGVLASRIQQFIADSYSAFSDNVWRTHSQPNDSASEAETTREISRSEPARLLSQTSYG